MALTLVKTRQDDVTLEVQVLGLVETAKTIKIQTIIDKEQAIRLGVDVSGLIKEIKSVYAPAKKTLEQAHKEKVAEEKELLVLLESVTAHLKGLITTFDDAQRNLEEQRRVERNKIMKERKDAETQALNIELDGLMSGIGAIDEKIEKYRQQLIDENTSEDLKVIIKERITVLEAERDNVQIDAQEKVRDIESVQAPQMWVTPQPQRVAGMTTRHSIDVEITDLKALVKAVADGIVPIGIIDIKKGELKSFAKMQTSDFDNVKQVIPGVVISVISGIGFRG